MAKKRKKKATKAMKTMGKSAQRSLKKAGYKVKKHGPLAAALAALGGFLSSILASDRIREGAEDLIGTAFNRAAKALGSEKVEAALRQLQEGIRDTGEAEEHASAH